MAHCRFTDFTYLNSSACSVRQKKNGPLHLPILNALEDVWIEREQAEIYPGCARAIARATELAIDRGHIIGQQPMKSNAEALLVMIACGLIGKQSRIERLVAIGDKAKAHLSNSIGENLTTRVWELACARIPACKTTIAADDLADQILTLVASAVPPEHKSDAKDGQKGDAARSAQGQPGNGTEAQIQATREMLKDATATYSDIADQLCEALKQSGATKPMTTGRGANWSETEALIDLAAHQMQVQRDFAASSRELHAFGARAVRVKSFEQSWRTQKAFIDVRNLGGTATERAVFKVALPLGARPEARRLLILVTDGEPADVAASTAAISELKSWGIESANLFLGNEGAVFERELRGQGFHVERCLRIDGSMNCRRRSSGLCRTASEPTWVSLGMPNQRPVIFGWLVVFPLGALRGDNALLKHACHLHAVLGLKPPVPCSFIHLHTLGDQVLHFRVDAGALAVFGSATMW